MITCVVVSLAVSLFHSPNNSLLYNCQSCSEIYKEIILSKLRFKVRNKGIGQVLDSSYTFIHMFISSLLESLSHLSDIFEIHICPVLIIHGFKMINTILPYSRILYRSYRNNLFGNFARYSNYHVKNGTLIWQSMALKWREMKIWCSIFAIIFKIKSWRGIHWKSVHYLLYYDTTAHKKRKIEHDNHC